MKKYLFVLIAGLRLVLHNHRDYRCIALLSRQPNRNSSFQSYGRCIWRSWWRLSSLNVNPAGSAILSMKVTITLSNNDIKIIQIILEQQLLTTAIPLIQAGGVFVFKIKIQAAMEKFSVGEIMKIPIILKFYFSQQVPTKQFCGYFLSLLMVFH
jgi:hypothetical protein